MVCVNRFQRHFRKWSAEDLCHENFFKKKLIDTYYMLISGIACKMSKDENFLPSGNKTSLGPSLM